MPVKKPATGRNKLIEQRREMKAENQEAVRQALIDAGEPLTTHEIAARVGISTATVAEAAVALGLYRRKAAHSERGQTLMGANPYVYWPDKQVPKRTSPIEASKTVTIPAPLAAAAPAHGGMKTVHALTDDRLLLSDDRGDLWVANRVTV